MDAVEDIKQRLGIEDVISEYVQLKRAGRNWKGLSPFTSEKTPSFVVSPDKQIWHDFSSNKGGDMFSFVMEMEGLDFKGALEILARKAGIDLEQYRKSGRTGGPDKERLYGLLELAAKFYQVQFSKHAAALRYVFQKRQFTKETALAWRLGYSPNTGTALVGFLGKQGYNEADMKQAGVTAQRYWGEARDMFRGRLMVPLADAQGRVIGFTARLLADDPGAPKYINTPQTVLYDKSRHVFGLHLAKEAIRKERFVIMTEGNLDVIASYQAGVRQTVAVAGTALTEQQLKVLSRLTGDIRLSFDADRAGVAATERAIPIASKVGVSLSIIDIPSGKDPDELIRQNPALWQGAVTTHRYALDWLMDRYARLLDITSAQGKRQYSDILLPIVRRLNDPVEQDHYLTAIAAVAEVSREALVSKFSHTSADAPKVRRSRPAERPKAPDKQLVELMRDQDHLLMLAAVWPGLRPILDGLMPAMFIKDESKKLLQFLQGNPSFSGGLESEQLLIHIGDYGKILRLQYDEEQYDTIDATVELPRSAAILRKKIIKAYAEKRVDEIKGVINDADDAERQQLLHEHDELNALRRQSEEATDGKI